MYLYWIDLFCCHSSSGSCAGCGGPERSHRLCHRLYHDHCILCIYGHGTGIVLSFVWMRCGTMCFVQDCGHSTGQYRSLYCLGMVQCTFPGTVGMVLELYWCLYCFSCRSCRIWNTFEDVPVDVVI